MSEAREVFLNENEILDGVLIKRKVREENGYRSIEVTLEFKDRVKIDLPLSTPAGKKLREELTDDLIGQRIVIAKIPGTDHALHVAIKSKSEEDMI